MAGKHPLLTRALGVIRSLDDAALAELANRGLVRRALKDLATDRPRVLDINDERIRLQVSEATVDVPELPSQSRCDCPASGLCRHILTAIVYLRDDPEFAAEATGDLATASADLPANAAPLTLKDGNSADAPPATTSPAPFHSPAEVFGNLTDQDIQKWAGKPLLRKALKGLAAHPQAEITVAESLVVRFPTRNVTCRWLPSQGLIGMVCSCQAETLCEHLVAAVLAYQVQLGQRQLEAEQPLLQESSGAPRTRGEVLESVAAVLSELVSLGLSRLSIATANRLTTLAVSAHGVDLPRLEGMLKALADEVRLTLRRDANSNSARLLAQAARLEALRLALTRRSDTLLVGQHRSQYFDVGQLTLVGLAAHTWQSQSGYCGLTVYFYDPGSRSWASWSEARPADQAGFVPEQRFRSDGPWQGCTSPDQASRSVLRLTGAWRNPQGRLSGRPSVRAVVSEAADIRKLDCAIDDWTQLVDRARQLFAGGLTERTENQDLVLIVPVQWGPAHWDSLTQQLRRPLLDRRGHVVDLWLPYQPDLESALQLLETYQPAPGEALVCFLQLVQGRLCARPITLHKADTAVHLNLDLNLDKRNRRRGKTISAAPATSPPSVVPAGPPGDESGISPDGQWNQELPGSTASGLGRMLITIQAELEAVAESGVAMRRKLDTLTAAARQLDAMGMNICARRLTELLAALSQATGSAESSARDRAASALLHAYYVVRLASDQEAITAACAGLA